jgi:hypothetical protein
MGVKGWNRLTSSGLLPVVAVVCVLMPGIVGADSSDILRNTQELLTNLPAPAAAEAPVVAPIVVPPLSKFTTVGRINSTLATGPCPGGPLASCSPGKCDQIQVSGPVIMSPGGKATISACLTIEFETPPSPSCFDEQGNGTLTVPNGDAIKIATGGHFCVSDVIPLPPATPTGELFTSQVGFTVEGGTGQFGTAVGQGDLSVPFLLPLSGPLTSTGILNMVGAFAKK